MVVIANAVVKAIGKKHPASQEERRGDDKLNQARDLASMLKESDLRFIKDKIT